jgi:hypothetical protein
MSKSSVECVHQMAIYMVCNIHIQYIFFNSLSELTFWTALIGYEAYIIKGITMYFKLITHISIHKSYL